MPIPRISPGSKYGDEDKYTAADEMYMKGQFADAINELGDDEDPPALVRKARCMGEAAMMDEVMPVHEKLRICQEGVAIALRAVEKDPSYSTAHKVVAMTKGRMTYLVTTIEKVQLSKEIKAAIDKALELDPDDCASWHVLAKWHAGVAGLSWLARTAVELIYGAIPRASYDDAIRCFLRAEECWSNAVNLYELAQVYLTVKKRAEAKAALEKAISSSDELPVYREAIENAKALLKKEFP